MMKNMSLEIREKTILVDRDGVLADFHKGLQMRWEAEHPFLYSVPTENLTDINPLLCYPEELRPYLRRIMFAPGFMEDLPPVPGAIEAINEMREAGFNVKICTIVFGNIPHWSAEKISWNIRHLGKSWTDDIILTPDKTLIKGDYLIDDKPRISGAMSPEWEHILFERPYNKKSPAILRLSDWSRWREVVMWSRYYDIAV